MEELKLINTNHYYFSSMYEKNYSIKLTKMELDMLLNPMDYISKYKPINNHVNKFRISRTKTNDILNYRKDYFNRLLKYCNDNSLKEVEVKLYPDEIINLYYYYLLRIYSYTALNIIYRKSPISFDKELHTSRFTYLKNILKPKSFTKINNKVDELFSSPNTINSKLKTHLKTLTNMPQSNDKDVEDILNTL